MNKTMVPGKLQLEIPLSKTKLFLMLLGALVFVAIGLWFVIATPIIQNPFLGSPTKIIAVGYASILFFGLCSFFFIRKLFDNKPGLIIDNTGITDNSSGVAAGMILWTDIENISVIEIHRQKLIMLKVKNPQNYIDKQNNGFKKKVMALNYKIYGTPLSITTNGLKIPFNELLAILNDKLKTN